ncbi:50S ribosomal protein L33 [Lactococcus carnosus]|uniref:Large ribosomal subunit protein bL33 n=1 Tax=Pseudolactococcus carnosus TaxID=2749961 RepID=A0ABT0AT45_9LACT|nr:50S ribosomal protein L33 [Lactococcus carnosus]MDN6796523.1 50S ribosomal protein L33 [Lactococcus sp.]SCA92555.1 ribosomal protein L33 [Lactococcus piscium]MCJ1969442.1 50S ribosomal protein L33 [Lactococcus carnosus]MCJ1974014.1 50S ribosomal protein L33 [Lactococcus carnosus]MCJ1975404.1 50S ribosomal protein L33 [Lactococcus carnosus]
MRVKINLKCTGCGQQNYISSKNKATHPDKVKVLKYCPKERKVIIHVEA